MSPLKSVLHFDSISIVKFSCSSDLILHSFSSVNFGSFFDYKKSKYFRLTGYYGILNMNCPKCNSEMEKVTFEKVEVDRCKNCNGSSYTLGLRFN
jgi:hypothetical protein